MMDVGQYIRAHKIIKEWGGKLMQNCCIHNLVDRELHFAMGTGS